MTERSIKEYFRGKTIFVTGGTGFIGKALLEKLLRSIPNLEKIYVLIRPKKGQGLNERLEKITSSELFRVLRKTCPEQIRKIIPIQGNTNQLNLGLSNEDRQLLIDEVHIFFHAAASVRFDDFLKDAIFANIRSAREAALLALEMKKIEVVMHVSTTYCNIDNRKVVDEILYPPHGKWRDLITIAETSDEETLNVLSRKFIGDFPNTYTYTKQLAEHCINELLKGKVPAVIFRPSVVVCTVVEPFPGWFDNFNGPNGILIAGGTGLLRIAYGDPEIRIDYVPVDNLVKAMIVIVWHQAYFGKNNELEVHHGSQELYTQRIFCELGKRLYWEVPYEKKIWFPRNYSTKCWYNYYFSTLLFHMVPAFFIDLLLRARGHSPLLVKIQRKIYIAIMSLIPFAFNEWYFVNTKTMSLLSKIPDKEKEDFMFNTAPTSDQSFYDYYKAGCNEARQILLKEGPEIKEKTRIWTRRLYYLDRFCHGLFYSIVFWLIFIKLNILLVFWNTLSTYWQSL